jgi:hypothetical protein
LRIAPAARGNCFKSVEMVQISLALEAQDPVTVHNV